MRHLEQVVPLSLCSLRPGPFVRIFGHPGRVFSVKNSNIAFGIELFYFAVVSHCKERGGIMEAEYSHSSLMQITPEWNLSLKL